MIRLKDGIHLELGRKIVVDSQNAIGDINIVSHAHTDHLLNSVKEPIIASEPTRQLCSLRSGNGFEKKNSSKIELIPSGHVLGSRAALIKTNKRILYTGDVAKKDRMFLKGINPPEADTLIIESTYGQNEYLFPEISEVKKEIIEYIQENTEENLFLFCYSLGKAQKIQYLIENNFEKNIFVHRSIKEINEVYNQVKRLDLSTNLINEAKSGQSSIFLFPHHLHDSKKIKKLEKKLKAKKLGFSGWALNKSYKYRCGFDKSFVFSDHADYSDLLEITREVEPNLVYTYHGFSEELAKNINKETGIEARPLKRYQSNLEDFS